MGKLQEGQTIWERYKMRKDELYGAVKECGMGLKGIQVFVNSCPPTKILQLW